VWVEPQVTVSVRLADGGPGGVVFESGECRLRGSDLLTQLGLDRRFVLYFHTLLTWQSGPPAAPATAAAAAAPTAQPSGSGSGIDVSGSDVSGSSGAIKAQVDVQVWTEVVGPFRAIPRGVLQVRRLCRRCPRRFTAAVLLLVPGARSVPASPPM
jgi:hypothetical protein